MIFKINSPESKAYAISLLMDCAIDEGLAMQLNKVSEDRTAAQNSLMWQIFTDMQNTGINEHSGSTKSEWYSRMKREFLVNIYERDDPNGYGVMMASLRDIYRGGDKENSEIVHKHIVNETSTRSATVAQFAEFLGDIMRWCNARGISYRMPGDSYDLAMGIKQSAK